MIYSRIRPILSIPKTQYWCAARYYHIRHRVGQRRKRSAYMLRTTGIVRQWMIMYGNVWQCTAMCGNLPSPEIQSGTIWYYHDLYRNSKEGRKEKCVYGCSNCMV